MSLMSDPVKPRCQRKRLITNGLSIEFEDQGPVALTNTRGTSLMTAELRAAACVEPKPETGVPRGGRGRAVTMWGELWA